jgi:hypothetical protein
MAVLLGVAFLTSVSFTESPCSFSDIGHWSNAQEFHDHARVMRDYAEAAVDDCTCACGPCAKQAFELAKESEVWADRERRELATITKACSDYIQANQ